LADATHSGGEDARAEGGSLAESSTPRDAAASGLCTWGTPRNGNGSFTWYYFGQGSAHSGGGYKTACGYAGSEVSAAGQSSVDTVTNVAQTSLAKASYFAAIPGASSAHFDTVGDCGACVEVTGPSGARIVATIVDECPTAANPLCTDGHLDLSTQAFEALGYSVGNPSGTTWKFVPCPVTGDIVAVPNAQNQYYLQNAVYPIALANGKPASNYGYFNVAPGPVTLVSSVANQTVRATIPAGGGDTGAQFMRPVGCPP
jgi:hypothetical protein